MRAGGSMKRIVVCLTVAAAAAALISHPADRLLAAQSRQAPIFEVDPFWPKPLPNHWVTGSTIGLSVDTADHVWTIHRPGTVEDNFKAADIMVGDAKGRDEEAQPGAASSKGPTSPTPIGKCC